ncbi:MAG: hypothetical protein ACOC85_04695, partial [Thermoplasmatota archaeon]
MINEDPEDKLLIKNNLKLICQKIPGILFLLFAGIFSWFIGTQIPYISYLLICILIGLVFSNIVGLPDFIETGVLDTH